ASLPYSCKPGQAITQPWFPLACAELISTSTTTSIEIRRRRCPSLDPIAQHTSQSISHPSILTDRQNPNTVIIRTEQASTRSTIFLNRKARAQINKPPTHHTQILFSKMSQKLEQPPAYTQSGLQSPQPAYQGGSPSHSPAPGGYFSPGGQPNNSGYGGSPQPPAGYGGSPQPPAGYGGSPHPPMGYGGSLGPQGYYSQHGTPQQGFYPPQQGPPGAYYAPQQGGYYPPQQQDKGASSGLMGACLGALACCCCLELLF
ncbi:hypothetical protein B0T24DRAFT_176347, partial [Lasiosphaeria ovina]